MSFLKKMLTPPEFDQEEIEKREEETKKGTLAKNNARVVLSRFEESLKELDELLQKKKKGTEWTPGIVGS